MNTDVEKRKRASRLLLLLLILYFAMIGFVCWVTQAYVDGGLHNLIWRQ